MGQKFLIKIFFYLILLNLLNLADASQLIYSTYLGGGYIWGGIAIDSSGNAYVTGYTTSPDYPVTSGAFDTIYHGGFDIFVTKLNATGSALLYSTYLGGSQDDESFELAIDSSGNAYITGYTTSTDYPVTPDAFDTTYHGGLNVFVSKLNETGTALIYSTFIGANQDDQVFRITVDNSGNAYIPALPLPLITQ